MTVWDLCGASPIVTEIAATCSNTATVHPSVV
jgi:hypothetical protein